MSKIWRLNSQSLKKYSCDIVKSINSQICNTFVLFSLMKTIHRRSEFFVFQLRKALLKEKTEMNAIDMHITGALNLRVVIWHLFSKHNLEK